MFGNRIRQPFMLSIAGNLSVIQVYTLASDALNGFAGLKRAKLCFSIVQTPVPAATLLFGRYQLGLV